jgi:hypothetical protein
MDTPDPAGLRGKVVATTLRPRTSVIAMTRAKFEAHGLIGAVRMTQSNSKSAVAENGIEDSAAEVSHALLLAAQNQYGAIPAASPVRVDTTDVHQLAQAASGADVLFDIQEIEFTYEFIPFKHDQYRVHSSFKFRMVDVHTGTLMAERSCQQSTKDDPTHPSEDELLANDATLLKQILSTQRDRCVNQFETQVLNVASQVATR